MKKTQVEMERMMKVVKEGLTEFDLIHKKLNESTPSSNREKLEGDLKAQLKKLQRNRHKLEELISSPEVKMMKSMMETAKKDIEKRMEIFKTHEKTFKTKAHNRKGLASTSDDREDSERDDVAETARGRRGRNQSQSDRMATWVEETIESLSAAIYKYREDLKDLNKKSAKRQDGGKAAERIAQLEVWIERHEQHQKKLAEVLERLKGGLDASDWNRFEELRGHMDDYLDDNENESMALVDPFTELYDYLLRNKLESNDDENDADDRAAMGDGIKDATTSSDAQATAVNETNPSMRTDNGSHANETSNAVPELRDDFVAEVAQGKNQTTASGQPNSSNPEAAKTQRATASGAKKGSGDDLDFAATANSIPPPHTSNNAHSLPGSGNLGGASYAYIAQSGTDSDAHPKGGRATPVQSLAAGRSPPLSASPTLTANTRSPNNPPSTTKTNGSAAQYSWNVKAVGPTEVNQRNAVPKSKAGGNASDPTQPAATMEGDDSAVGASKQDPFFVASNGTQANDGSRADDTGNRDSSRQNGNLSLERQTERQVESKGLAESTQNRKTETNRQHVKEGRVP
eukprot:Selendium_serpulae@DN1813_c0_g1_i3.p1